MDDAAENLAWLKKNARFERDALFVFELERGSLPEDCAERAGFSGGTTDDPEKRRANLKSAASKAASSPRIKQLREAYRLWLKHGDSQVADESEILARITAIMRTSTDAGAISAAKSLLEYHRKGRIDSVNPGQVVRALVARVGAERVRAGLESLGMGGLATIALQNPPNLAVVALDNGHYGETGGQKSHTSGRTDLSTIARGCGLVKSVTIRPQAPDAAKPQITGSRAQSAYGFASP